MEEKIQKSGSEIGTTSSYVLHLPKNQTPNYTFSNVIGHEKQKEELIKVLNWFSNVNKLREKGLIVPKGILLYGDPGNGKSLIIKEIIEGCDCPVLVLKGEPSRIGSDLEIIFEKAAEYEKAIVVIDEVDLILADPRMVRILQSCLDGVESSDRVFVISATNSLKRIPDPLLRKGRYDKIIEIPAPSGEEALLLFKKSCADFKINLPSDFDDEEISHLLGGIDCSTITAIANDVALRNGFENITEQMIEESIYRICNMYISPKEKSNIDVSVHECGHAFITLQYPEFFKLQKVSLDGKSGSCSFDNTEDCFDSYDEMIARIKIAYAGIIAQKVVCHRGSCGCDSDIEKARQLGYSLFTRFAFSSCWECLTPISEHLRSETPWKRRNVEKKIEKLLRKCEKDVTKIIKKNSQKILKLGELLLKKNNLKYKDIIECLNAN